MHPRVMLHRILPPSRGGLRSYHVTSGSGTRLSTKVGSNVATCTVAPDLWGGLRSITCSMAPDPASYWEGSELSCVLWSPVGHRHK
jgi:hypothetical protein